MAPEASCVTVTYLDDRPIAAFWGSATGTMVHLGMLVYSPFLAEHSPGKLHIMQLSDYLLNQGLGVLDLTPGGDPWKERFSNAHDEVAEAIIYRSALSRLGVNTLDRVAQGGRQGLARLGLRPAEVRANLALIRRAQPAAIMRQVRQWLHL